MSLLLVVGLSGPPEPSTRTGWDDAGRARRPRQVIVYYDEPPEVVEPVSEAPKRRKVTRKAVEAAVEIPWGGDWGISEAMSALPDTVPVLFTPPYQMQPFDIQAVAIAMWLRAEAERRQQDEDEMELLLMAA